MAIGLAVLGLSGCLGEESVVRPPPSGDPSPDSILILRLHEDVASDARHLFLVVRTSTLFPCFNYPIEHLVFIQGQTLWIQFTGVSIEPLCAPAFGPARAIIPLGSPAEGSYRLVLTVRGQAQVRELTVTPEAFTVRPANGAWTVFEDSVLHRLSLPNRAAAMPATRRTRGG